MPGDRVPGDTPLRYMILFEGRTGSTMMGQMLNQHTDIIHIGEDVSHLQEQGWEAQKTWMDRLYFDTANVEDPRIKPGALAVGFKVKLRRIASPPALSSYLEQHQIRVMHMTRENKIKQIVSSIRAIDLYRASGNYNTDGKNPIPLPQQQEIPLERFNSTLLWLLEAEQQLDCFISKLKVPVIKITYEELFRNRQNTLSRIFEFLHVETRGDVLPETRKITPDDLQQVLTNYGELKHFYRHTRFGPMFD